MNRLPIWAVALTLGVGGCGELTYRSDPVGVAQVAVDPGSVRMHVGTDAYVQVRVLDADGGVLADRPVTVSVGDFRVATPMGLSTIRGLAEGSTIVRYTSEGVNTSVAVTVISPATRLSLSGSRSTLYLGDSLVLTALAFDANGRAVSAQSVRWTSLVSANASVSAAGVVRGIAPGRAAISAQLGDAQATIEYYVTDPMSWIKIDPANSSIALGDSLQLRATAVDSWRFPLPGRSFTWRATSPNILDVTSNGLVKARGLGWGDVAATSGSVVVFQSMLVIPQPLASVAVIPGTATLKVGARLQMAFAMTARNGKPTTTDGRWINWSSGYELAVDNYGMVTAFSPAMGSYVCVSVDDQKGCARIVVVP